LLIANRSETGDHQGSHLHVHLFWRAGHQHIHLLFITTARAQQMVWLCSLMAPAPAGIQRLAPRPLLARDRAFFSGKDDQDAVGVYKAEPLPGDGSAHMTGLLDQTNPQNPVRDWSMLFVPYCTDDVHSGSNVPQPAQRLPSPARRE
jgi:hypothetical protein